VTRDVGPYASGTRTLPRIERRNPWTRSVLPAGRVLEGMTRTTLIMAAALALLAGCSPDEQGRGGTLQVWAHDHQLEDAARAAAVRIQATTGIVVRVNEDHHHAVPMFYSESLAPHGWWGLTHQGGDSGEWIAIGEDVPEIGYLGTIVLHEMLHALGAEHVDEGAGVLSPHIAGMWALTAADLAAVCAVAACSRFEPER
jgi:hypothetical protein